MSWAKVDDRTHEDPRTEAAGVEAMGLWALALSYMAAHSTDGRITVERCRRLAGAQKGKRFAERLVAAGWWEAESDGSYRLVGWERLLLARSEADDRSSRAAAAGKKGGEAKAARRAVQTEESPKIDERSGASSGGSLPPSTEPSRASSGANHTEEKETALPTPAPDPDPSRPVQVSAQARTREDPLQQGDTLPLVDRTGRSEPRSADPEQRGSARTRKGSKEPRAEDLYAEAYAAGSRDAGFPLTPLLPNERKLLGPIAATHAHYRDDTPITGQDLPPWFRRRARAFRLALVSLPFHRGGASVLGFRNWLDEGADGEDRPLPPGQDGEEPPAEYDADAELLELMKAEDAAREAARTTPRPVLTEAELEESRAIIRRWTRQPEKAASNG